MPLDQRRDDALLAEPRLRAAAASRIEIFGAPELSLRVASDRPSAFVVARLCDVGPDGARRWSRAACSTSATTPATTIPGALEPGDRGRGQPRSRRRLRGARRPPAAAGDLDELLAVVVAVARARDDDDRDRRRQRARSCRSARRNPPTTTCPFRPAEQAPPLAVTACVNAGSGAGSRSTTPRGRSVTRSAGTSPPGSGSRAGSSTATTTRRR